MTAIYSLWNMGDENHRAGFNAIDDLMYSMKLSMIQSCGFFERVVLVTDSIGAARAEKYGLPYDELKVELDRVPYRRELWAMVKLMALDIVRERNMMHIDNDFIWWQDPSLYWVGGDLLFQNPEPYWAYGGYNLPLAYLRENYPHIAQYAAKTDYAYNCGVIGIKDPADLDEWLRRTEALATATGMIENLPSPDKGLLNLVLEQSFAASLAAEKGLRVDTVLSDVSEPTKAITHLLSTSKRNKNYMSAIRQRVEIYEQENRQR